MAQKVVRVNLVHRTSCGTGGEEMAVLVAALVSVFMGGGWAAVALVGTRMVMIEAKDVGGFAEPGRFWFVVVGHIVVVTRARVFFLHLGHPGAPQGLLALYPSLALLGLRLPLPGCEEDVLIRNQFVRDLGDHWKEISRRRRRIV